MKRKMFLMLLTMVSLQLADSQNTIKACTDGVPGNNECPYSIETFDGKITRFVSFPALTVYLPDKEKNADNLVVIRLGRGY